MREIGPFVLEIVVTNLMDISASSYKTREGYSAFVWYDAEQIYGSTSLSMQCILSPLLLDTLLTLRRLGRAWSHKCSTFCEIGQHGRSRLLLSIVEKTKIGDFSETITVTVSSQMSDPATPLEESIEPLAVFVCNSDAKLREAEHKARLKAQEGLGGPVPPLLTLPALPSIQQIRQSIRDGGFEQSLEEGKGRVAVTLSQFAIASCQRPSPSPLPSPSLASPTRTPRDFFNNCAKYVIEPLGRERGNGDGWDMDDEFGYVSYDADDTPGRVIPPDRGPRRSAKIKHLRKAFKIISLASLAQNDNFAHIGTAKTYDATALVESSHGHREDPQDRYHRYHCVEAAATHLGRATDAGQGYWLTLQHTMERIDERSVSDAMPK